MKQSNAFLAAIMLTGFLILFIYGTTVIDLGKDTVAETRQDGGTVTALDSPTVDFADPVRGPRDAKLTIVEFGNFTCSACADLDAALQELLVMYPKDVRIVWKDVANDQSQQAVAEASMAARCAWQQGAFWEYHHMLMSRQDQLIASNYMPMAAEIGLDLDDFQSCVESRRTLPLIERTTEEAMRLRLTSVPTLFIGERRVDGALTIDQLKAIVDAEMAKSAKESADSAKITPPAVAP